MAYKGAQPFSASPGLLCFLHCICSALAHAEDDLSKLQEGVQVAHHGSSMAAKMCQDVRRFVFLFQSLLHHNAHPESIALKMHVNVLVHDGQLLPLLQLARPAP